MLSLGASNDRCQQNADRSPKAQSQEPYSKKPEAISHLGLFSLILPAATYSPMQFPTQYHRR